jgi:hypothetical protein
MLLEEICEDAGIYEVLAAAGRRPYKAEPVFTVPLELRRTPIRPAHGTHDRAQGCDCADRRQHEQSHHQEECSPYVMEDNMIH